MFQAAQGWTGKPVGADIPTLLLAALAIAGAILLIDVFILKPRRTAAGPSAAAHQPVAVAYARSLFPVLLAVVLFRSFLFEPFHIPSASMMPGLVDGDFILVDKFRYGLRLPLTNTKVLSTWEPQRGDVVVFRSTSGPPINLIKRLVGLPGDHVVVRDNHVTINGMPAPLTPDGRYADGYGFTGAPLQRERLGRADHEIMLAPQGLAVDFDAIVPAGHYFFMGDNRNDSEDSRFEQVGFVPEDHLVGHAVRIWMNWRIPGWPRLGRIGTRIQ
ncbi:MAG: signal peptidase [Gammaproteobacteria bacterium]|nr:signal peptidase [Gammaproteobacteria bacterium]